jgi:GDP-D-mannose 3', 5'-epimerase
VGAKVLVTGAGGVHRAPSGPLSEGPRLLGEGGGSKIAGVRPQRGRRIDLRRWENCLEITRGVDELYALAADMGGMAFISAHHGQILYSNSIIDLHTLEAARLNRVKRYFYASSACIYPEYRQTAADVGPLKEEEVYPAQPQDAYGWEKLIAERLCTHYREDYGLETRVARFHNIFAPLGAWDGGREKAPAALCRKVAVARLTGSPVIEIWGDGEQTRSFCYVDDCVEGIHRVMRSGYAEPLNLGQDRMVTINQLADIIAGIAGVRVVKQHVPGPQGVRGRNSDNTRLRQVLGWEPRISLEEGLARTYRWIEEQIGSSYAAARASSG